MEVNMKKLNLDKAINAAITAARVISAESFLESLAQKGQFHGKSETELVAQCQKVCKCSVSSAYTAINAVAVAHQYDSRIGADMTVEELKQRKLDLAIKSAQAKLAKVVVASPVAVVEPIKVNGEEALREYRLANRSSKVRATRAELDKYFGMVKQTLVVGV
jgi:hypothetical protein